MVAVPLAAAASASVELHHLIAAENFIVLNV